MPSPKPQCHQMLHHAKQTKKIDAEEFVKINLRYCCYSYYSILLFRPLFLCLFCVTNCSSVSSSPNTKQVPQQQKNDVPKFGLFRDLHLTPITLLITQLLQKKNQALFHYKHNTRTNKRILAEMYCLLLFLM